MEQFAGCKLDNPSVFLIWNYSNQILIEIAGEKATRLVRISVRSVLVVGDLNEFRLYLGTALQIKIPSDLSLYALHLVWERAETESIISVENENYIGPRHWGGFDILNG